MRIFVTHLTNARHAVLIWNERTDELLRVEQHVVGHRNELLHMLPVWVDRTPIEARDRAQAMTAR
jgi:hypothetical protein